MHFGFAWKDLFLLSLPKKYFPPIKAKIKCFQSPSDPSWPFILAHSSALKGFTMCRSKWPEENIQRAKAWVGSTPSFCHHQASVITTSRCLGACCWLQAPVVFSILRVQSLNLRHWTLGFRAWGLNISPASLSPWGWPGRCWFPASEPQALPELWCLLRAELCLPAQGPPSTSSSPSYNPLHLQNSKFSLHFWDQIYSLKHGISPGSTSASFSASFPTCPLSHPHALGSLCELL